MKRALVVLLAAACSGPQQPGPCDGGVCPPPPPGDCDAGTMLDTSGACVAVGWTECPQGFEKDPSGWGCSPVIAESCDAGTMPRLGQAACAPVGWTTCTAGFARDDAGWGCEPVLPVPQRDGGPACFGATREALGTADCIPIGDCSDAGFPPLAATLFVDDSYATVDATHFRSIGAAMSAALPGATIAIESGTYRERLLPNRSLNLVGRCPATVIVQGDGGTPAVRIGGPLDISLEGLTVTGGLLGFELDTGAKVTGKKLVIDGNRRIGVRVLDGDSRFTLQDSVVRGTLPDSTSGTFGIGIAAAGGAQLDVSDVAFQGNRERSIYLDEPATHLEGRRLAIVSTLSRANGQLGYGLIVQGSASLDIHGIAITNSGSAAVVATGNNSRATLTDFVIRGTRVGADSGNAPISIGASAQTGGRVELTSGALLDSAHQALNAAGAGSRISLTNSVIRGLVPQVMQAPRAVDIGGNAQGALSHVAIVDVGTEAINVLGGTLTLDDVLIQNAAGIGVRAQGASNITGNHVTLERTTNAGMLSLDNGRIAITDCAVRDTRLGQGAVSQGGATASFERCLFERNGSAGLYAAGGSLSATGVVVRGTLPDQTGEFGQGVVAERGGSINLQRVLVDRNRVSGLQTSDAPSNILAIEVIVRDTQPDGTGKRGRGANSQFGATLSAYKSAFLSNRQVGVFAFQSKVVLEDVLVLGTQADPDGAYGNGIEALTDGDIAMTRGSIASSAGIGAVFAEGAGLLDAVRVVNNPVGVHTQDGVMLMEVESAPMMRGARDLAITRSTVFEGNATKVGTGEVAVPMP